MLDILNRKRSVTLTLTSVFAIVKLTQFIVVLLAPGQFDTSTHLLLERYGISCNPWWRKLLSWDAVYFLKNSQALERPEFEHEWAFSWIWARMIRCDEIEWTVFKGVVLNLVMHYVSCWLVYVLTRMTFSGFGSDMRRDVSLLSAVLFAMSSGGGFLISIYSEPLSFMFSLFGMILRQASLDVDVYGRLKLQYWKWIAYACSSICFTVSFVNRSNCLLLGLFYVVDFLDLLRQRRWFELVFYPILCGSILLGSLLYYQFYLPFTVFCPNREEWCGSQNLAWFIPFSSFYSFIQSKYWDVGLFNYWTLNNVPNFLFATPNLVVLWLSTSYFSYEYPLASIRPLVYITRSLIILVLFFAHVQIINRISSFIPLHIWYVSDVLTKRSSHRNVAIFYILWLVVWIPLQTALFACFLPPA